MLRLSQNLSLQQRMAPQLIQSLQLLQMSTLELELEIKQQMEVNPLLEESMELDELEEEDPPEPEIDLDEIETPAEEAALEERELQKEEVEIPEPQEEVDWDSLLDDQLDSNSYNSETTEYDPNWEQDREPQENRITTMPPLIELLHEQLLESELKGDDVDIADFIIGNIDDRGYLTCTTEEISEAIEVAVEEVERVLGVIQSFEPPGVGARDLSECLLIQLRLREGQENYFDLELAQQVVRSHMDDLTKRRYSRITKALGIENDDLKGAMEIIEDLHPNPGAIVGDEFSSSNLLTLDTSVNYITPDLIVEKAGEDWVVSLTDGNLPSLRINASYAGLLKDGRGRKDEVRSYVSKKLNDARWLINAINQRRTTMLKVANYIVRAQMDWFERGPAFLKPMVLQDVADAVGMHVSTISRVSNGKYMQTPHGVRELKYFFDSKVSRDDGEDVSARSVKEKISVMIDGEDKARPLSDQAIADELAKDGLKIARRTVAKYRDQLGINSQRYRKEMF
jgi:RNA polymerase sigma-54 factor